MRESERESVRVREYMILQVFYLYIFHFHLNHICSLSEITEAKNKITNMLTSKIKKYIKST